MARLEAVLHLACGEDLTQVHGLGKALQHMRAEIAILKQCPDQAMCFGCDHDGVGFRQRLQACRQVGGLANRGVLLRYALTDQIADDDHA